MMQYIGSSIEIGDDRLNSNLFHIISNEQDMNDTINNSMELTKNDLFDRILLPERLENFKRKSYLNAGINKEKDIIWFLDDKNQVYHFFVSHY